MSRVVILGGGPAGLGAAYWLASRGLAPVVIEQRESVGGNAGSFELAGLRVDYGSHRLHPAADPGVLATLRELLGDDLLERPRHGRIRLLDRWLHFPLRPLDLVRRAPPRFAAGVATDVLRKLVPSSANGPETFASVLERGLGRTICRDFYFPYARKIWGIEPEEIASAQAYKRVSSGSIGKMLKRLLPAGRGSGGAQPKGVFYYPRRGFGQISEAVGEAARDAGAELVLGANVERVAPSATGGFEIEAATDAGPRRFTADRVWSTIPLPVLARLFDPPPAPDILEAAGRLELRSMLLVYLVLDTDRFTEYDAHYFPGADIPFTRLSEPKNYAALREPAGRTVLCAELPCSRQDAVWSLPDADLGKLVGEGLATAGLPVRCDVLEVATRRLPAAYPIYREGWDSAFDALDVWQDAIPGLLTFGRQGLFAHDNTHHALYMARCAVDCLADDGDFDDAAWARHREVFESHVVED